MDSKSDDGNEESFDMKFAPLDTGTVRQRLGSTAEFPIDLT
jgi:hypothetical protein